MGMMRPIVVIERDEATRRALSCALTALCQDEKRVKTFNSVPRAEAFVRGKSASLVVLDATRKSLDLIDKIKGKDETISFVVVSGKGNRKQQALEIGADAFLQKPFIQQKLYRTLGTFAFP